MKENAQFYVYVLIFPGQTDSLQAWPCPPHASSIFNCYSGLINQDPSFLHFSCLYLKLCMPIDCSHNVQESEQGSWHVPTVTGDDLETPRMWLCATRSGKSHRHSQLLRQSEKCPQTSLMILVILKGMINGYCYRGHREGSSQEM